jgi:hypothetical protein
MVVMFVVPVLVLLRPDGLLMLRNRRTPDARCGGHRQRACSQGTEQANSSEQRGKKLPAA